MISKLLKKERSKRLGANGDANEILAHPFFNSLDMTALENYEIDAPFLPTEGDGVNKSYFNVKDKNLEESLVPKQNRKLIEQN